MHYMHTDDVFMGILVNKTKEFRTGALLPIKGLSLSEEATVRLKKAWEGAASVFYHVPNIKLFYTWYFQGNTDWRNFAFVGS